MKARINGIELAYTDSGQGEPVILLHGYPLNRAMWDPIVSDLSLAFRVIAPDLRGHGESEAPEGTYSMDLLADDVHELMEHLGLSQAVLVGFSMGGYAGFAFYRKYSEAVRALVLMDTRPQPDSEEGKAGRETTAQTVLRDGVQGVAEASAKRMLAPATAETRPEVLQRAVDLMTSTPVNGYVGDLRGLAERPDSTPTLSRITCPTLVMVGAEDVVPHPLSPRRWRQWSAARAS